MELAFLFIFCLVVLSKLRSDELLLQAITCVLLWYASALFIESHAGLKSPNDLQQGPAFAGYVTMPAITPLCSRSRAVSLASQGTF